MGATPRVGILTSLAAVALTVGLGSATVAPVAMAQLPQLPPGVTAADIVGAPISVPAGQTTTVDFGVPVSVNYVSGGWTVVSSGTSVSVTAPAEGGSTASVPVSAAGQSATLTLVAEGAAAPAPGTPGAPGAGNSGDGAGPEAPGEGNEGTDSGAPGTGGGGEGAGPAGGAAAPTPERKAAAPADRATAESIHLESEITGNQIVATLGLREAMSLFNQFRNIDQEGLKLRYLDVNGQIIEGVQRDIDEVARKLTLTYPEGQTPDNPFIMEVVRDDTTAVAVVTLTDPNFTVARPASPEAQAAADADRAAAEEKQDQPDIVMAGAIVLGVLVLVAVVAVVAVLMRKRRR